MAFAYLLARSDGFRTYAILHMTGSSGRQRVPADSLTAYKLAVPDPKLPVFRAFGQMIEPIFRRCDAAMAQSRALAGIRDELLPRLISGEIHAVY